MASRTADPPKRLFLPLFRGQLSPPKPTEQDLELGYTVSGPVFAPPNFPGFTVQGGPYQSLWVRAIKGYHNSTISPTAETLDKLLATLQTRYRGVEDSPDTFAHDILGFDDKSDDKPDDKQKQVEKPHPSYAFYVALRHSSVNETALIPLLLEKGFVFHRFRDACGGAQKAAREKAASSGNNSSEIANSSGTSNVHDLTDLDSELCYYRWMGQEQDRVPYFGSTNGGVGALILDKTEKKILLVFEYGWWKPVTGMVSRNESKFEAIARECKEEVGVDIEGGMDGDPRDDVGVGPGRGVFFVGGWQSCGAWDLEMNDEFSMFVVHAASEKFSVDGEEIKEARWVDIDMIKQAAEAAGETGTGKVGFKGELQALDVDGLGRVSPKLVYWLQKHLSGTSFRCSVQENNRFFFN
tara:strand:+ start:2771 stop:4000 length:1230 start_codon:yes stop_codon:yes gene_type:complete